MESNYEHGAGRPDIAITDKKSRKAIVIEVKHSQRASGMLKDCSAALQQIRTRSYADDFLADGYRAVWCYGAAFYGKSCLIQSECIQNNKNM